MPNCLWIYYRTHSGSSRAPRPSWFSKELCFRSLVYASKALTDAGYSVKLKVFFDGHQITADPWYLTLQSMLGPEHQLVLTNTVGNSPSFSIVLESLTYHSPSDSILIAEDDYLWLPKSLAALTDVLRVLPADYITGYDHPDRYDNANPLGKDIEHYNRSLYVTKYSHWRPVESTCMTFMTSVHCLMSDMEVFQRHLRDNPVRPNSRSLFRQLQGLISSDVITKRKLLIGSVPALCTHAQLPYLAPVVDWMFHADKIREITNK